MYGIVGVPVFIWVVFVVGTEEEFGVRLEL